MIYRTWRCKECEDFQGIECLKYQNRIVLRTSFVEFSFLWELNVQSHGNRSSGCRRWSLMRQSCQKIPGNQIKDCLRTLNFIKNKYCFCVSVHGDEADIDGDMDGDMDDDEADIECNERICDGDMEAT